MTSNDNFSSVSETAERVLSQIIVDFESAHCLVLRACLQNFFLPQTYVCSKNCLRLRDGRRISNFLISWN